MLVGLHGWTAGLRGEMRDALKSALGSRLALHIANSLRPGRVVALCFHDLRADDDFSNWLRFPATSFDRLLLELGQQVHFIAPGALEDPRSLEPSRVNVLVTFDDGYVNNLHLALPILSKHKVPALFFISSGPMLDQKAFRADRLLTPLQALRLQRLDLSSFGLAEYHFVDHDGPARWEGLQQLLGDVKHVGNDDHPKVAAILEYMESTYHAVLAEHLPRFRPLTPSEVQEMARNPLVHIGSHSHRHEILTRLDDDSLTDNLVRSRRELAEITGRQPTDFAYPNGDWDARVARLAEAAGYSRAWTVTSGLVAASGSRMSLPRILVGGYDRLSTVRFQVTRLLLGSLSG